MEEKLRIFITSENLTASKFAEILDVNPAAISHILKGRNKPSCELLCKIVTRFPKLNPYWLMGDAAEMYNNEPECSGSTSQGESYGELFEQTNEISQKSDNSNIAPVSNIRENNPNSEQQLSVNSALLNSGIEKILIIYKDQTFEEIRPKKS